MIKIVQGEVKSTIISLAKEDLLKAKLPLRTENHELERQWFAAKVISVIQQHVLEQETFLIQQEVIFFSSVYTGENVKVHCEMVDYDSSRQWITLSFECRNEHNHKIIAGQVVMHYSGGSYNGEKS